ncbi:MAG: hypothetical protein IJW53_05965 [Clostridia bacterium]|nr:hypothetical protein [Clostridia bacterium]
MKTTKLVSLILVLTLVLALASCDILASFLPTGDQTSNGESQNSGNQNGNETDGAINEGNDNSQGEQPSDKDEGDNTVTDKTDGENEKDPTQNEGENNESGEGNNDEENTDDNNVNNPDDNKGDNSDDVTECSHVYANNVCISCSKQYIIGDNVNNCVHEWASIFCNTCGARCDHKFDTTTCEYCGYVSGGIDNPVTIHFEGSEIPVPYSATFFDVVTVYMAFDIDVEMSFINDEWAIEIDGERRTVGMYECPADYGRDVWLVYLGGDVYPGGDSGSNPAIVYIISVIDNPAYVPFTIESDTPLSGEEIIQRAGIENPERFYIYVNTSELYDLDNFRLMIFTESINIEFHLAG